MAAKDTNIVKKLQKRASDKRIKITYPQVREILNEISDFPLAPTEEEQQKWLAVVFERYGEQPQTQFEANDLSIEIMEPELPVQQETESAPLVEESVLAPSGAMTSSNQSNIPTPSSANLGITQQQIQEAVEQQFGKENVETKTAILNYVAQDTFSTAKELQTALSKLRQMRLDILMKLIADHNNQASTDEGLLKNALLAATANRQKETEDFFGSFESQLAGMRATFGL